MTWVFFFLNKKSCHSLPEQSVGTTCFWNISADKFYASCCKSRGAFMQKYLYIALHHMDKTNVQIPSVAINITVCVVIGQSLADYFLSLFPSLSLIHFAHSFSFAFYLASIFHPRSLNTWIGKLSQIATIVSDHFFLFFFSVYVHKFTLTSGRCDIPLFNDKVH